MKLLPIESPLKLQEAAGALGAAWEESRVWWQHHEARKGIQPLKWTVGTGTCTVLQPDTASTYTDVHMPSHGLPQSSAAVLQLVGYFGLCSFLLLLIWQQIPNSNMLTPCYFSFLVILHCLRDDLSSTIC